MFTERATGARQSDKQSQYVRYLIEFSARPKHEWVLLMSAFYTRRCFSLERFIALLQDMRIVKGTTGIQM